MKNAQIKQVIDALNVDIMNESNLEKIRNALAILNEGLSELLDYKVEFKYSGLKAIAVVSLFEITVLPRGEKLVAKYRTLYPLDCGLDHENEILHTNFDLNWEESYKNLANLLQERQLVQFGNLEPLEKGFLRSKSKLRIVTTGFSDGAFGTSLVDSKNVSVGRVNKLEAEKLAKQYGQAVGCDFKVIASGQRSELPFWELKLDYALAPKVEELRQGKERVYRFKDGGKLKTFKVIETTSFGDEIRVDKVQCLETGTVFNQGVASFHTDVITGHINRDNRKARTQ